jgi:hypothetical protein
VGQDHGALKKLVGVNDYTLIKRKAISKEMEEINDLVKK